MDQRFFNIFIPLKEVSEIINDAYIVIDTNVLLMAYQWRDMTFKTVYDALCELSNNEQLKIPSQVIKEFAKNRPGVIQGLYQEVNSKLLSSLQSVSENRQTIDKVVPAHDMISEDQLAPIKLAEENYLAAIKELNKTKSEYKHSLQQLQVIVKNLIDKDPISHQFKEIFEKSYIEEVNIDEAELNAELKRRKDNLIPPGYKDKGHKGDYLIWKSILSLKDKPVIFVTGDNKADWVYSVGDDVLGARRELVEEFYEENSQTIKILTPLQFIEEYSGKKGESVDERIRLDLRKQASNSFLNSMLKDDALNLISGIRRLLANYREEQGKYVYLFHFDDEDDRERKWNEKTNLMETSSRKFMNLYNELYKIQAILMREKLLDRLPKQQIDESMEFIYENPTNPLGVEEIADDLEKLARRLNS